jgi:iron complex outermembrane receptor protein
LAYFRARQNAPLRIRRLDARRWRGFGPLAVALTLVARVAAGDEPPVADEGMRLEDLLVIAATLHEQSVMDAPAAITVVTADDIVARGYRSLSEILADVAGFNEVSDINEEIIGTRGVFASTTNATLILINGHRMNDVLLGRYNVDQYLGIEAVERIELILGPAAALYGTGALVGVVNIITKRGRDLDGTQLKYTGGPYTNEASLTGGKLLGGYDFLFDFTFRDQSGQEIPQPAAADVVPTPKPGEAPQMKEPGKIYWRRYPENFSALVDMRSDDASITLRGEHFRRVTPRGSTGSFYDYAREPYPPTYTENDLYIDGKRTWTFGPSGANRIALEPSLHYFSYFEQSFFQFGANRVPPLGTRSGKTAEMHNYQLKLTYDRTFLDNLSGTLGLDCLLARFYRMDSITIDNGEVVRLFPNGYAQTGHWLLAGLFAQAVYSPLKTVTITAGARFDTFEHEADPKLTPRVGVVWRPRDQLSFKLLYGQSYLAPQWAHRRAGDFDFMGNPNLKPETFRGGDAIAMYQGKRLAASLDLYLDRVDGLINAVRDSTSNVFSYLNTGTSVYMGLDATVEAQLTSWLRMNGGYSFIRPDEKRTVVAPGVPALVADGNILDIPTHTLRYGLRLDPRKDLTLSLWGRYTGATSTDDPILHPVPPRPDGTALALSTLPPVFLLDASAVYTWKRLLLRLLVTNLTDRYYERGGTVPRPLARNGRMVEATAAYRF